MGWTLLAFHSIYVSSGVEYAVRFIVPFYYYFKVLVLIATFVLPSLRSLIPFSFGSAGSSASNPLIVAWFNYVIVPGVYRIHELMDHDPKRWAKEQLVLLPLLFLDFFILPGILLSDEERRSNDSVTEKDNDAVMENVTPVRIPPASAFRRADNPLTQTTHNQSLDMNDDKDTNKPATDSAASPYRNNNLLSPPRRHKTASPFDNTLENNSSPFFPRTSPIRGTETPSKNLYIISPVAKSRVASSALRLRRFSREHEPAKLTPRVNLARIEDEPVNLDTGKSKERKMRHSLDAKALRTDGKESSSTTNENESSNIAAMHKPIRKRRKRLSLGDHFRELVTGDANIRVRDHLFDLDLYPVPCPSPRHVSPRGNTSKITTRRSSRIAKSRTRQ
jgi:hypothetical protein